MPQLVPLTLAMILTIGIPASHAQVVSAKAAAVESADWRNIIGTGAFSDYILQSAQTSDTVADAKCPQGTYVAGGSTSCRDASGSVPPLHSSTDANNGWRAECPAAGKDKATTEVWALCLDATVHSSHKAP